MLDCIQLDFQKTRSCANIVSVDFFDQKHISCFDNDGFELSLLEQAYYKANNFPLNNILNHNCFQVPWFTLNDNNFILDHAMLLERKDFDSAAKDQLIFFSKKFPQLLKYLKLKPKWGIDFALEYHKDGNYMEVLHIEYDYYNIDEAVSYKEWFQQKILDTDWNDFLSVLVRKKEEWINLKGFQQNDYKARLWGLPKAEDTLKSFA